MGGEVIIHPSQQTVQDRPSKTKSQHATHKEKLESYSCSSKVVCDCYFLPVSTDDSSVDQALHVKRPAFLRGCLTCRRRGTISSFGRSR